MTKRDYLLLKLMEECAEVSYHASKQLQFGKDDKHPTEDRTNGEQLRFELMDVMAITSLLVSVYELNAWSEEELIRHVDMKFTKICKYYDKMMERNENAKTANAEQGDDAVLTS